MNPSQYDTLISAIHGIERRMDRLETRLEHLEEKVEDLDNKLSPPEQGEGVMRISTVYHYTAQLIDADALGEIQVA